MIDLDKIKTWGRAFSLALQPAWYRRYLLDKEALELQLLMVGLTAAQIEQMVSTITAAAPYFYAPSHEVVLAYMERMRSLLFEGLEYDDALMQLQIDLKYYGRQVFED